MRKKKKETIVIQNTPLVPTTIGVIEKKEGGPIFTIIWIGIFILAIYFLPQITDYIKKGELPSFTSNPSKEEEPKKPPIEETPIEVEYLSFNDKLSISKEGFSFQYFVMDDTSKTLEFRITNQNGKSPFFKTHKYYLEFYTSEKLLLKRIKIPSEEIIKNSNLSYDFSNVNTKDIALVALVEKEEKDYPPVTINPNNLGVYELTCSKEKEALTYEFESVEDQVVLMKITESTTYLEEEKEYDTILKEKTDLNKIFDGINGLESELIPIRRGFRFNTTIDLKNITKANLNLYFKGEKYYEKNTIAKTIAFEMEGFGYTCQ